ncbi:MAG: transporter substrate binding protein [Hyphomicrobiales bacterium]|nr:transporter substrate binding protein [Hyphomicrobiales bacterium]
MDTKYTGSTRRHALKVSAAAAGAFLAAPYVARAQSLDAVKLALEFRIYGGNAPSFYAGEMGMYKDLGLAVTADGSSGSGEAITRVASGAYEFGLADASAVVEFAGRNPDAAPKIIMPIFDVFPAVVLSLKRKPIKKLQDLVGAKLGTGTADAGSKILPALLALNKIDPKSVNRSTIDVKLRDTMLLKGDVDAVIAFDYTAIFNLMDNGLALDDINLLYFADSGFNFFGNSLIASQEMIKNKPDVVKRMAVAVARSWVQASKHRDAAIDAVMKRDKLLNPKIERARMDWVIDRLIRTENVKKNGLGAFDMKRMEDSIATLSSGLELPNKVTPETLFDGRFMPAASERMIG